MEENNDSLTPVNNPVNNNDFVKFDKSLQIEDKVFFEQAESYFNQGRFMLQLKDYKGAIENFSIAINLRPNNPDAYNNRGSAKWFLKDYTGALLDYTKAVKLNPDYSIAYNNCGLAKAKLKDNRGAIEDYSKAIELNPNYVNTYINRGDTKVEIWKYEEALEDYSKCIEIDPNNKLAYIKRGRAKARLNDYRGAIKDYTKAIEINPEYANTYIYRGNAKAEIRKYKEAIEDYTKCIEINPNNTLAYIKRGDAEINAFLFSDDKFKDKTSENIRLTLKEKYGFEQALDHWHRNKVVSYRYDSMISFGKYKGEKLSQINLNDPQYILWCINNLIHFSVKLEVLENITHSDIDYFLRAIEINILKLTLTDIWNSEIYNDNLKYCTENNITKIHLERDTFSGSLIKILQSKFGLIYNRDYAMNIFNWESKNIFNKYKELNLEQVFLIEPQLIIWSILNKPTFAVIDEIIINDIFKKDDTYLKIYELNYLKCKLEQHLGIEEEERKEEMLNEERNERLTNRDAFDDDEQYDSFMADKM